MQRSTERFLTTHTGSLPRPEDLVRTMYAKETGVPVEAAALARRVARGGRRGRAKQADAGLDIVNDGEMSKPSYATYIKDRLAGFGGDTRTRFVYQDLDGFPEPCASACSATPGARGARRRRATRRSRCAIPCAAQTDVDHLRGGFRAVEAAGDVPDRRVARRDLAVLPQRVLPEPTRRTCSRSPRRCATSTRRSPRGHHGADRLPRPRDGTAHRSTPT